MQIRQLSIGQFQGIQQIDLTLSAPVLLVSGNNGAGKSSVLDALALAMTGQPRRVALKKELQSLVREGCKRSLITMSTDLGELSSTLPAGKGAHLDAPFLPFVLDAGKFCSLDTKARRSALFELVGASADPATVCARMIERGCRADLVEKIKPMLRAGFGPAADHAKEFASQARGAWKAVTGETYGSEKADGWMPPAITAPSSTDRDAVAREIKDLQADLADAHRNLGELTAAARQNEQRAHRITELKEAAGRLPSLRIKRNRDHGDLVHWTEQLKAAREAVNGKTGLLHDMARVLAEIDQERPPELSCKSVRAVERVLCAYRKEHGEPSDPPNAEFARRVDEIQGYVDSLTRATANNDRDVKAAEDAAAALAALEGDAATPVSEHDITAAQTTIAMAQQLLDAARARQAEFDKATARARESGDKATKAAQHHADVSAWVQIAESLAPTGIPAEILSSAIGPFNNLLAEQSEQATWPTVRVSDAFEITYAQRPYALLSESERWRCDALVAIAIARLSGLKIVTLDRFDVLQPSARPQILQLCLSLTRAGELGTVVLAGTMKEPMARVPPGMQQIWIENGRVAEQHASQAA